jgi:hypothetical protein
MIYALNRADGGVTITTIFPKAVILSDGTSLPVAGLNGFKKQLLVVDPETQETLPVAFACDAGDLDANSIEPFGGTLVFPTIEEEIAKMPVETEYVSTHRISMSDVPQDLGFREAWVFSDGLIIDMVKACAIHKDRMRAARAPLLAALDIEYQRADEASDAAKKTDVVAKKNALRDVTDDPAIAAAMTPEALRAVWPAILSV